MVFFLCVCTCVGVFGSGGCRGQELKMYSMKDDVGEEEVKDREERENLTPSSAFLYYNISLPLTHINPQVFVTL